MSEGTYSGLRQATKPALLRGVRLAGMLVAGGAALAAAAYTHGAAAQALGAGQAIDFDEAFAVRAAEAGMHFKARYVDAKGVAHQLEEWREGAEHLRRRTDDRIDLHADRTGAPPQPGLPAAYSWQVIDLAKKIDHRISSTGMMRAGMLYSYWSMAHVLERPAGVFSVTRLEGLAPVRVGSFRCRWFLLSPSGVAPSRVCWSGEIGVPLRTEARQPDGSWMPSFEMLSAERGAVPKASFAVDTKNLRVMDADAGNDED